MYLNNKLNYKISGVAWRGFALPFKTPFISSNTEATIKYGLLLCLTTEEGSFGIGESSPIGAGTISNIDTLSQELSNIASILLHTNPVELESKLKSFNLSPELLFGIETALLDLEGKINRFPISGLIGGKPTPFNVNALIASDDLQEILSESTIAITQGFTTLKIKIGNATLQEDEEMLSALRKVVGPNVKIRLDPNQAWTVEQAIESIRKLEKFDIEYIEQPVSAKTPNHLAIVRSSVGIPIAADEALGSLADAKRIFSQGEADILIIKAARLGGISKSMEIIDFARENGKDVVVTSSLESDIGIAASAHLVSSLPNKTLAQGLSTSLLFNDNLGIDMLVPISGRMYPPHGNGLGIDVDLSRLDKHGLPIVGNVGELPNGWGKS